MLTVNKPFSVLKPLLEPLTPDMYDEEVFLAECPNCGTNTLKASATCDGTATVLSCTECVLSVNSAKMLASLGLTKANLVLLPGQSRECAETSAPEWDPITPFGDCAVPTFPADKLPAWMGAFAEAVTAQCETPPDLACVLVLAVVAAAVAGKAEVCPHPGWYEPLNLYCIVALPPASRKSAVFKLATKPLLDYEWAENQRLKPLVAQMESERRVVKARLEEAEQKAAKAKTKEERDEFTDIAVGLAKQVAEAVVPGSVRLFTDDCTLERLAGLMSEQQGRMAVLSPEGGFFGTLAGRYSERGANIDVVLKGHSGDIVLVDRVNRPFEGVESACLTLGLAVQPGVLQGLAHTPGFRDRGLLARFLYSLPASNIGYRPNENPAIPAAVKQHYHDSLHRLLVMEVARGEDGKPCPKTLTVEPEAAALFLRFRQYVEKCLRPEEFLSGLEDWGGKLAGAVARIAGVMHMAQHGDTSDTIDYATMGAAIEIGKYFAGHALAAFELMGADPEIANARHVLKWMEQTRCTQFTQREVHHALQSRFKRVDPLERALRILAERYYLRAVETEERGKPGRKPSTVYLVNPSVHNSNNCYIMSPARAA